MKATLTQSVFLIGLLAAAIPASASPYYLAQTFDDPSPSSGFFSFNGDGFGGGIDLDGDYVLVGAERAAVGFERPGQAHLYDATTGDLVRTFNDPTITQANSTSGLSDQFGTAVALDGGLALVGAPGHNVGVYNDVGEAHLFDLATGALLRTIASPAGGSISGLGSRFGEAVAMSDGRIVIGSPGKDLASYINIGQVHVFRTNGSLIRSFNDTTPSNYSRFGASVAIDGDLVLVGAPSSDSNSVEHGEAFLFNLSTGQRLFTFDDPTPTNRDFFGQSVAIDGDLVLIGDARDDTADTNVGQAHLFSATTGQLLRTFEDPTRGAWDFDGFGESVSLENGLALIGAPFDQSTSSVVGQAHLFDAVTGVLLETFDDPTPTNADDFGGAVVLNEGRVLIGAPRDDTQLPDVGQAHLFRPVPEPTAMGLALLTAAAIAVTASPRR
jgi:hypothetical protein